MVRDTFAAFSPGVTINIAPLLSLSADQHSKFMQKRQTPKVFSLHLDAYRTKSQQKEICALLLGVASHGSLSTSVVVFSSAQAFTDNPIYRAMLHSILNMKLVLVCIDEVHHFVQFGLWFRSEFVRLKSVLSDRLRCGADSEKTHVVCIRVVVVLLLGTTTTTTTLCIVLLLLGTTTTTTGVATTTTTTANAASSSPLLGG
jgi:superfamily II DNA helicase RecQ